MSVVTKPGYECMKVFPTPEGGFEVEVEGLGGGGYSERSCIMMSSMAKLCAMTDLISKSALKPVGVREISMLSHKIDLPEESPALPFRTEMTMALSERAFRESNSRTKSIRE